jgi:hypothetical protein
MTEGTLIQQAQRAAIRELKARVRGQPDARNPINAYLEVILAGTLDAKYPSLDGRRQNTSVTIAAENLRGVSVMTAIVHRADQGTREPFKAGSINALLDVLNDRYFADDPDRQVRFVDAKLAIEEAQRADASIEDAVIVGGGSRSRG